MLPSVLLVLTMCVSAYTAGLETLSQSAITAFLSGLNQIRSALKLPDLVWNSTVASVAGSHLSYCRVENIDSGNMYAPNPKTTDSVQIANEAIAAWRSEVLNKNAEWFCLYKGICVQNYQLAWRNTTSVGCAIFLCSGYGSSGYVKCEYYPPK